MTSQYDVPAIIAPMKAHLNNLLSDFQLLVGEIPAISLVEGIINTKDAHLGCIEIDRCLSLNCFESLLSKVIPISWFENVTEARSVWTLTFLPPFSVDSIQNTDQNKQISAELINFV